MHQSNWHMLIFSITVHRKLRLPFGCLHVVFLDWTVSNTQKCPSWLPPGAAWLQHCLLDQTCCSGYAAPEAALADHQLWNGLKPSWQSRGEPAALKAAQAFLCFTPRSNSLCCCPWCNGFFREPLHVHQTLGAEWKLINPAGPRLVQDWVWVVTVKSHCTVDEKLVDESANSGS